VRVIPFSQQTFGHKIIPTHEILNMLPALPFAPQVHDVMMTIQAMSKQENNGYKTEDYFSQANPEPRNCNYPQQLFVNAECRSKMAEWCYQVVDHCKFKRETVAITMSYVDRYMMTDSGKKVLHDRKTFQLVAMTSLYTAVKIHEPEAMDPKVIAGLSRGAYTENEVTDMEMKILKALKWRMNPPTAMSFLSQFLSLLTNYGISECEMGKIAEIAKLQIEASVNVHSFLGVKASHLAFAALSNAVSILKMNKSLLTGALTMISKISNISSNDDELLKVNLDLFKILQQTFHQSEYIAPSHHTNASMGSDTDCSGKNIDKPFNESPRSVCP
jgi:hypothetical protein